MFERFTDKARRVVVGAQEEARERGADAIRTEHVLASLYTVPDNLAVTVLAGHGVDRTVVGQERTAGEEEIGKLRSGDRPVPDPVALATLGIDLDEVRRHGAHPARAPACRGWGGASHPRRARAPAGAHPHHGRGTRARSAGDRLITGECVELIVGSGTWSNA